MDHSIIVNVDVESSVPLATQSSAPWHLRCEALPVRIMIHGLHVTWLQHPMSFRKIFLCKGLSKESDCRAHVDLFSLTTYCLVTGVANCLAHQLVDPLGLISK